MKLCFPVLSAEGLRSQLNPHFGSSPTFLLVDTATKTWEVVNNSNAHHGHGNCQPLAALTGRTVDGVVVGGLGMGALNRLLADGIEVFISGPATVAEALGAFEAGNLPRATPQHTCAGHGHGGGCGNH